jgi:alanine racemase
MPVEGVRRPAWAEIDASAIAHNVRVLRDVLGDTAVCAVVKANGYGHGAVMAAQAAVDGGATSLAVAIVDEGIELRNAGLTVPILLLAEIPADTLADAMSHRLTVTVGSRDGALAVAAVARTFDSPQLVHLKIDTGMRRMGVSPDEALEVAQILSAEPRVDLEGLYTHFPVADGDDEESRQFTLAQVEEFDRVHDELRRAGIAPRVVHTANTAASVAYPQARRNMARVGLALYGYVPAPWLADILREQGHVLRPALSLHAQVVAVRRGHAGDRPSYGRRRPLASPATVATVPFGYADGYPRRLFDAGAEVLLGGRRYPLAGAVTMDQILLDCGDDAVHCGDEVVLLGQQGNDVITADEWARRGATISWEILCGIGARVPRVVTH